MRGATEFFSTLPAMPAGAPEFGQESEGILVQSDAIGSAE